MSPETAKLDPQARIVLERAGASKLPALHTVDALEARRIYRETRKLLFPAAPEVAEVRELSIPRPEGGAGNGAKAGGIPARSYLAAGAPLDAVLPGMVYFHGGGWIYGDLDTHDIVCRSLANHCACRVFSVDYRLAPEHRFPAGVEDAIAATRWVADNAASLGVDPARLIVAGDSAGGNLAAVVALALRDGLGSGLAMQVLIYPATDQALATESHSRFAQGFMLTRDAMLWVRAQYLRDERDIDDWRASPLRARDFSRLPPAYILTAGFDPLQDEGRAYAECLIQAGVPVTYESFEGQIHGFVVMGGAIAAANHAIYRVGQTLRLILARLPVA